MGIGTVAAVIRALWQSAFLLARCLLNPERSGSRRKKIGLWRSMLSRTEDRHLIDGLGQADTASVSITTDFIFR